MRMIRLMPLVAALLLGAKNMMRPTNSNMNPTPISVKSGSRASDTVFQASWVEFKCCNLTPHYPLL